MKMDASKFQVIVHTIPDAHVLHLSGELDLSTAEIFRSVAQPLAAGSALPLKLNLRELTYIDSTGIGLIVALLKTRQSADARLAVQEVPAKIRRLFDTTGLTGFCSWSLNRPAALPAPPLLHQQRTAHLSGIYHDGG